MTGPTALTVLPDAEALAERVATELATLLVERTHGGRCARIVLTGGRIADAVHRRMASAAEVPWDRVEVFWGDERYLPAEDERRNSHQAARAFLDVCGVSRRHPVLGPDQVASAEDAAARYAAELPDSEFDLVMLSLGEDGHVASLFPGAPALEESRSVVAVHDSPKPPPVRVSMTPRRLGRATRIWMLVSGEEKAAALAQALAPGDAPTRSAGAPVPPARWIHGPLLWWVDAAAHRDLA